MAAFRADVLEVRAESAAAGTVAFMAPGFTHRPGQWIRIDPHQFPAIGDALRARAEQRGKPEGPGYFSLSSDGLTPGRLEITVKVSDRPGGSPLPAHLAWRLRPGDVVTIDGPGGTYGYPDPPPAGLAGFIHVCAGSGVAPNRGLIRHALRLGWPQRHLLVLQDRTPEDHLFRREWELMIETASDRFRLRGVYSKTVGEYVSAELIRASLQDWIDPKTCYALVCGPNDPRGGRPGFCDLAKASLAAAGVQAGWIRGEP